MNVCVSLIVLSECLVAVNIYRWLVSLGRYGMPRFFMSLTIVFGKRPDTEIA